MIFGYGTVSYLRRVLPPYILSCFTILSDLFGTKAYSMINLCVSSIFLSIFCEITWRLIHLLGTGFHLSRSEPKCLKQLCSGNMPWLQTPRFSASIRFPCFSSLILSFLSHQHVNHVPKKIISQPNYVCFGTSSQLQRFTRRTEYISRM